MVNRRKEDGWSVVFRGCFFLQKHMKLGFCRDPGKTNQDFNGMLLVGVVARLLFCRLQKCRWEEALLLHRQTENSESLEA